MSRYCELNDHSLHLTDCCSNSSKNAKLAAAKRGKYTKRRIEKGKAHNFADVFCLAILKRKGSCRERIGHYPLKKDLGERQSVQGTKEGRKTGAALSHRETSITITRLVKVDGSSGLTLTIGLGTSNAILEKRWAQVKASPISI